MTLKRNQKVYEQVNLVCAFSMKCTRAGPSVLRIAEMVTAPLICTNKYDNLSIKLVTTAVRIPRVWDESCGKKEMEL